LPLRGHVNSPRVRFISLSLLYAAVLYIPVWLLLMSWSSRWWLGYTPMVVAVMLAAQGVSWRRKAIFASVTVGLSIALFTFAGVSGIGRAASALTSPGVVVATNPQLVAFALLQVFFLGVPLAALAMFVGRRPSVLWTSARRDAEASGPSGLRRSRKQ